MTTATRTKKEEVQLIPTSTPNFFYAPSSNGFDVYALLITGPGRAICTCPGFEVYHRNCKHRKALLAHFIYIDPEIDSRLAYLEEGLKDLNTIWEAVEDAAETEAEKDAYRDLFAA